MLSLSPALSCSLISLQPERQQKKRAGVSIAWLLGWNKDVEVTSSTGVGCVGTALWLRSVFGKRKKQKQQFQKIQVVEQSEEPCLAPPAPLQAYAMEQ